MDSQGEANEQRAPKGPHIPQGDDCDETQATISPSGGQGPPPYSDVPRFAWDQEELEVRVAEIMEARDQVAITNMQIWMHDVAMAQNARMRYHAMVEDARKREDARVTESANNHNAQMREDNQNRHAQWLREKQALDAQREYDIREEIHQEKCQQMRVRHEQEAVDARDHDHEAGATHAENDPSDPSGLVACTNSMTTWAVRGIAMCLLVALCITIGVLFVIPVGPDTPGGSVSLHMCDQGDKTVMFCPPDHVVYEVATSTMNEGLNVVCAPYASIDITNLEPIPDGFHAVQRVTREHTTHEAVGSQTTERRVISIKRMRHYHLSVRRMGTWNNTCDGSMQPMSLQELWYIKDD